MAQNALEIYPFINSMQHDYSKGYLLKSGSSLSGEAVIFHFICKLHALNL